MSLDIIPEVIEPANSQEEEKESPKRYGGVQVKSVGSW